MYSLLKNLIISKIVIFFFYFTSTHLSNDCLWTKTIIMISLLIFLPSISLIILGIKPRLKITIHSHFPYSLFLFVQNKWKSQSLTIVLKAPHPLFFILSKTPPIEQTLKVTPLFSRYGVYKCAVDSIS